MSSQAPQENNTNEIVQQNEEEYEAPSLTEYGQVVELTKGTGSMNPDMVANRRKN
jgi:hypothetical protein